MVTVRQFDDSVKLQALLTMSTDSYEIFFGETGEDYIIGYVEIAPYEFSLQVEDNHYIVVTVSSYKRACHLSAADANGAVNISNDDVFRMLQGEIYDVKKKSFVSHTEEE